MDDFVAPVKGMVKAFDTGIKVAKRASRSAGSAPGAQALQISESAHSLQKTLEGSSQAIIDAYKQSTRQCGERFTTALVEDKSLHLKFKELRVDLIDQINECDFDEEEPESFNPTAFTNLQQQAQRFCTECIAIFNNLRDRSLQTTLQQSELDERPKDDRAQLSSMKAAVRGSTPCQSPHASISAQDRPVLALETPAAEPSKPKSPWKIDGPSQYDIGLSTASGQLLDSTQVPQAPYGGGRVLGISSITEPGMHGTNYQTNPYELPYPMLDQMPGRPVSEVSPLSEIPPLLIRKDIVHSRLNQNEEFLERRKQSRILFQQEMRKSGSSIEENRASQALSGGSISGSSLGHSTVLGSSSPIDRPPIFLKRSGDRTLSSMENPGPWSERLERPSSYERNRVSEAFSDGISPIMEHSLSSIDGRPSRSSASGFDTLKTGQRSQGQASHTTRSSRTSSIVQDIRLQEHPNVERKDSQASQESIFGLRNAAPLSPPLSEHRASGYDNWGHLATTLHVPGFGKGVEPGLEVVDTIDRDNGLILANEDQIVIQPTPTVSLKSMDYPMRHDSSFYKFGGFCEGAKLTTRGEVGFRVMKRPSGHYSATVSARCVKCSYEVGWNDIEKDRLLERSGIYGHSGIRFRQKFISKCHLRTNDIDQTIYGCIFCIEEHCTVEEHDATVFFSVTKLFQHLAKHSQPLPNIAGISIVYGFQPPDVLDFDIHFTTPERRFQQFSMAEIAPKAASRPAAHTTTTHHPKNNRSGFRDPEGNPTLHFAAGARIVGITFPDRFHGQWCIGYHDGERGSFPTNTIMLEIPTREDVLMNAQSNLVAFAKWDFKPKDAKEGGWLRFSKGDRISAVGYTFQDQWCWSGQVGQGSKSRWGLFPAAFVEGLQEDRGGNSKPESSPGSVKTMGGLGLGGLGSIIGRHKSGQGHERRASVMSSGSTGSGGLGGLVAIQPGLEVVQSSIHARNSIPIGSSTIDRRGR